MVVDKKITLVLRPRRLLYFLGSMELGNQPYYGVLMDGLPIVSRKNYHEDFIGRYLAHLVV